MLVFGIIKKLASRQMTCPCTPTCSLITSQTLKFLLSVWKVFISNVIVTVILNTCLSIFHYIIVLCSVIYWRIFMSLCIYVTMWQNTNLRVKLINIMNKILSNIGLVGLATKIKCWCILLLGIVFLCSTFYNMSKRLFMIKSSTSSFQCY